MARSAYKVLDHADTCIQGKAATVVAANYDLVLPVGRNRWRQDGPTRGAERPLLLPSPFPPPSTAGALAMSTSVPLSRTFPPSAAASRQS
eukprot:3311710-Amphidinium_carterae.2